MHKKIDRLEVEHLFQFLLLFLRLSPPTCSHAAVYRLHSHTLSNMHSLYIKSQTSTYRPYAIVSILASDIPACTAPEGPPSFTLLISSPTSNSTRPSIHHNHLTTSRHIPPSSCSRTHNGTGLVLKSIAQSPQVNYAGDNNGSR